MLKTLQLVIGDDAQFDIPVVDGDGAAVDITGWLFWLTVKMTAADADEDALLQVSSEDDTIAIVDAAGGVARATIAAALTAEKTAATYLFDIQAKKLDGAIQTLERGYFKLIPQITQATA